MSSDPPPGANPYAAPEAELIFPAVAQKLYIADYAGFWRRFAAFVIDCILSYLMCLMIVVGFTPALIATGFDGNDRVNTAAQINLFMVIYLVMLGVNIGYYVGMESSPSQATLGKMALGLKVCDLQGRRPTFGRTVGRFIAKILSGLLLGIGYLLVAFTGKKQGLHDLIAGTLVVKTR